MLSSENTLDHGRHVATDGVRLDVIMVGTWMLCWNGRNLSGRYHGWHMGALWERTEFVWTLSWLAHGCSVGTDGVRLDVIMVGTWVLCGNGRNLSGRYHGWHMGALWERTEFVWTLSWLAHGCSVGTDGICLDAIMVGTWVLWGRTEFVWTLSWLAHGCSVGTDGICLDVIMVGTWMLCGNGRNLSGRYGRDDVFDRASPRNTVNTKGLEASTLALLLPPRTHERRSVFSCKVHEAPQIPMRSACARRAFTARRYL